MKKIHFSLCWRHSLSPYMTIWFVTLCSEWTWDVDPPLTLFTLWSSCTDVIRGRLLVFFRILGSFWVIVKKVCYETVFRHLDVWFFGGRVVEFISTGSLLFVFLVTIFTNFLLLLNISLSSESKKWLFLNTVQAYLNLHLTLK